MFYRCLTCDKEYTMKPNAKRHAGLTGHINMEKVEEYTDD